MNKSKVKIIFIVIIGVMLITYFIPYLTFDWNSFGAVGGIANMFEKDLGDSSFSGFSFLEILLQGNLSSYLGSGGRVQELITIIILIMVLVQLAYLLQIINLGITIAQKKLNKILFTILYVISVFFMQGYPIVIAVLGSYVKQNIKSSYGDIGLSIAGSAVDKSLSAMQNSLGVGYYIFMGMAVLILIVLILDMKAVRGKLGHLNWYCWIFGDAEDVETANSAGTNGSSGTNGSGGTAGGGTYGSSGTNGGGSYGSSGTNGGGTNGSSGTNGGGANGSSGINGGGTNGSSGTNGGGTSGSGIAGEPNEVVGKLHVLNGRYGNLYIDIQDGERITIGRDPGQCNLVLEAPNISSVHCDVIFEGGVFYVIDHSMNGTFYLLSSNNNKVRLQKDVKESISVGKTISITENGVRIRLEI